MSETMVLPLRHLIKSMIQNLLRLKFKLLLKEQLSTVNTYSLNCPNVLTPAILVFPTYHYYFRKDFF